MMQSKIVLLLVLLVYVAVEASGLAVDVTGDYEDGIGEMDAVLCSRWTNVDLNKFKTVSRNVGCL